MPIDQAELLSALIDGESVDTDALAAALEDPEARRALVAFARVRERLHTPVEGEAEWLAAQSPPVARERPRPGWRVAAAAALLAAGIGTGVWAERYAARVRPPTPDRVVQLDPILASR
jgi:hypothetical protein